MTEIRRQCARGPRLPRRTFRSTRFTATKPLNSLVSCRVSRMWSALMRWFATLVRYLAGIALSRNRAIMHRRRHLCKKRGPGARHRKIFASFEGDQASTPPERAAGRCGGIFSALVRKKFESATATEPEAGAAEGTTLTALPGKRSPHGRS